MITVQQLISRLQDLPPDMPVVVGGFDEWGYADLRTIAEVEIAPVLPRSHGPDYELPTEKRCEFTGPPFRALHLDA